MYRYFANELPYGRGAAQGKTNMATPAPGKVVEDVHDAPSPAIQDYQDLEKEDTVEFVDPLPKDYECPLCLQVRCRRWLAS